MTHRQPTHRDIGKQCEHLFYKDRWYPAKLRKMHWRPNNVGEVICECVVECFPAGVARCTIEMLRVPIDTTDPAAQLAVAADALSDAGMDLAAEVLRKWPQVTQAVDRIVVDEGIDAGVILLDGESRTQWNNELQRSEYVNQYFSELGEALVRLSRLIKGVPDEQPASN
jgi:hypothetical protein